MNYKILPPSGVYVMLAIVPGLIGKLLNDIFMVFFRFRLVDLIQQVKEVCLKSFDPASPGLYL